MICSGGFRVSPWIFLMANQFIICGASRSGKSILARRLQEKFKISWILGDAIVSSMEDAFPD
jgi:nicotinamide riboside kinase